MEIVTDDAGARDLSPHGRHEQSRDIGQELRQIQYGDWSSSMSFLNLAHKALQLRWVGLSVGI